MVVVAVCCPSMAYLEQLQQCGKLAVVTWCTLFESKLLLLQVLDFELQRQLVPYMKDMMPLPGIYDQDFIAANQVQLALGLPTMHKAHMTYAPGPCLAFDSSIACPYHLRLTSNKIGTIGTRSHSFHNSLTCSQEERATNVIKGSKAEQVATVRQQIREFKESSGVDKVIVLWTANTERYAQVTHSCF
jgi:hypothetical protein